MSKRVPIAIVYDFDGTLAPGNMQEHSFIPTIGFSNPKDFWDLVVKDAKDHNMDEILSYMKLMIEKAKSERKETELSKDKLREHGQQIKLFSGVEAWFPRIQQYAAARHADIEHYIVSSGIKHIIEGTSINKKFKHIFASNFVFDQFGAPSWPALAINYTNKTQYLFRISKGVLDPYDTEGVNRFMDDHDRPFPFENMVYLGDGETDIPAMKLLKQQGGYSVVVYDSRKRRSANNPTTPKTIAEQIKAQGRADYIAPADYSEDKELDSLMKQIIDEICAKNAPADK